MVQERVDLLQHKSGPHLTIDDLIDKFNYMEITDARDKVYGLRLVSAALRVLEVLLCVASRHERVPNAPNSRWKG